MDILRGNCNELKELCLGGRVYFSAPNKIAVQRQLSCFRIVKLHEKWLDHGLSHLFARMRILSLSEGLV